MWILNEMACSLICRERPGYRLSIGKTIFKILLKVETEEVIPGKPMAVCR
jgi:hypothetical protein